MGNVALSLSIYLMMEQNTDEYVTFLRVLHRLRLNYVCCCCHRMIDRQLAGFAVETQQTDGLKRRTADTEYENISIDMTYTIKRKGVISIPTETADAVELIERV